jgi:PBP1b-binding outer membrane lipoprotein LpoB
MKSTNQVKCIALACLNLTLLLSGCSHNGQPAAKINENKAEAAKRIPQAPTPGQSNEDFYIAQQKARFEQSSKNVR